MSNYNDKLYKLVIFYLDKNGITDKSSFRLSNDGNGTDSVISKWGYNIPKPSKDQLMIDIDNIKPEKNNDSYFKLSEITESEPDLKQEKSLFVYKGNLACIIDGKLKMITF